MLLSLLPILTVSRVWRNYQCYWEKFALILLTRPVCRFHCLVFATINRNRHRQIWNGNDPYSLCTRDDRLQPQQIHQNILPLFDRNNGTSVRLFLHDARESVIGGHGVRECSHVRTKLRKAGASILNYKLSSPQKQRNRPPNASTHNYLTQTQCYLDIWQVIIYLFYP